jgi:fido (protein-threonine AMPylation protein)
MPVFQPIPGETPITDFSELKVKGIFYRSELNRVEATNIARAMSRYLGGTLTRKEAPFDYAWLLRLHREMFEDVWGWAGRLRTSVTNIGIEPLLIEQRPGHCSAGTSPCRNLGGRRRKRSGGGCGRRWWWRWGGIG